MRINFRSRFWHQQSGSTKEKTIISGNEWDSVSAYDYKNDVKKIIWKKSTHNTIYQKNFSDFGNISAIFCHIENVGDFFGENSSKNRNSWKEESIQTLNKNAKFSKISFKNFHFSSQNSLYKELLKNKIQRKSIFIISNSSPEESYEKLEKLAHLNEIFWILPYHPFEKNPDSNYLFLGKIFHKKRKEKYLAELEKQENFYKNILKKLKIPLITTNTSTPIENTLHYFFKYHYE